MSQADERERVKARIRALAEKTVSNGCTEAEAMAAAAMVGRLLERYALSMDEVEVRAERCVQVAVPVGGRRRRPIDGCVAAVARFCDCKVWLARGEADPPRPCYIFFGFAPDTEMAAYLFAMIDRAIQGELDGFRAGQPRLRGQALRRASASFQYGMAARVAERLEAMHQARESRVAQRHAAGTALVLAKHLSVEEAFRATGVRLGAAGRLGRRPIDSAFRHGWSAGERVNLNRPVGAGRRGLLA